MRFEQSHFSCVQNVTLINVRSSSYIVDHINFQLIFYALQEKVLCRVCFEGEISTVLLPCRHRVLCRYYALSLWASILVTRQ